MEWVKGRKLPLCEVIQYNGQPCHTMPELWDALHNTYNSAADRPCDLSVLDELLDLQAWEWAPFSALELMEELAACSSLLSPGPDHVTWVHLKKIIAEPQCLNVFIKLANACLTVGRWPKHFKESVLVIIPKPSKPSYSTPKAFRPIALLNTLGNLIEKMLSNRIQHNMIAYNVYFTGPHRVYLDSARLCQTQARVWQESGIVWHSLARVWQSLARVW